MPFEDGNTHGKGRPPGSENKLTRKAKYYAEKFLDEIEKQGVTEIARTGKMSDYIALLKSILPSKVEQETTVTHTQPIKIEFEK
jgi:hypothetical protein